MLTPRPDYPLPPDEGSIEILRVVVRESMSRDLLDRLIADIFEVTEALMKMDAAETAVWQPLPAPSMEKMHGSRGYTHAERDKASRPMKDGVHRAVC